MNLPDPLTCAVFPLPNIVFFPKTHLPLHIFEPRYREMTADALAGARLMVVAQLRPGWESGYFGRPPIYDIATVGRIERHEAHADGKFDILLDGLARVRIGDEMVAGPDEEPRPYRVAECRLFPDAELASEEGDELGTAINELTAQCYKIAELEPKIDRWMREVVRAAGIPETFTHLLGALFGSAFALDPYDRQCILEEANPLRRARLLAVQGRRIISLLSDKGAGRGAAPDDDS